MDEEDFYDGGYDIEYYSHNKEERNDFLSRWMERIKFTCLVENINKYPDLLDLALELGEIAKTVFCEMEPEKQQAFIGIITDMGIGLTMERDDEDGSQADS